MLPRNRNISERASFKITRSKEQNLTEECPRYLYISKGRPSTSGFLPRGEWLMRSSIVSIRIGSAKNSDKSRDSTTSDGILVVSVARCNTIVPET